MNKETVNIMLRVDQLPVMSRRSSLWRNMCSARIAQGNQDGMLVFHYPKFTDMHPFATAVQVKDGWVVVQFDWMNGKVQSVKFTEELPS